MSTRPILPSALVWAALILTMAGTPLADHTAARAQDVPRLPPDLTSPPGPAADSDAPLREQTIYIPYNKLREVFEREGRGVFVPYEQFQKLWQAARQTAEKPNGEDRPPVAAVIGEIDSQAAIERDVVLVRAEAQIELLGKGWHQLPLRLADAGIRSASFNGEPARLIFDAQTGYSLLVHHDQEAASRHVLQLEYARPIDKAPGLNRTAFHPPQAPVNRWTVRIPEPDVQVNIQPFMAITQPPPPAPAPADPANPAAPPARETVVMAFVGAADEVRIEWTPKAEGATGLTALADVRAEHDVSIAEGVVRTRVHLAYQIRRAELARLTIEIPADQKLVGVFDANVKGAAAPRVENGVQVVDVELYQPARGEQKITVELERFGDDIVPGDVTAPVVRAVGVERQQGVVVVRLAGELRGEPLRRTSLLQMDAAELPASLASGAWSFAYRYGALPFELALRVEKVAPRLLVEELVEAYFDPPQLQLDYQAVFDIQRAGVFQLEFQLPPDFSVRQVQGVASAGAEAANVDSQRFDAATRRLRVDLSRKALGRVGLLIQLVRPLDDPNLREPTGVAVSVPLALPRTATAVERASGKLIVHVPESLQVRAAELTGARAIPLAEAAAPLPSLAGDRHAALRPTLSFAYGDGPAAATFSAERRKPFVTVRQLLVSRIDSGVVRHHATFFYDIKYSPVKLLRIDLPAAKAADIRLTNRAFNDAPLDPPPADVGAGYVARGYQSDRELLGEVVLELEWEVPGDELAIGASKSVVLPVLKPRDTNRAWGQVVVAKAETLDLQPGEASPSLRPIDPQHDLMPGASVADAARAFEFHDDWSLTMQATRYQLEDVKRTSIDRALVRAVVTESDRVAVQALFRLKTAVQRLRVQLPAGWEVDRDPLYINGAPQTLETDNQQNVYIPLVGLNANDPVVVELRYHSPGDHRRLEFPIFPAQEPIQSQPALQKVYFAAYLPEKMRLIGSQGPWTREDPPTFEQVIEQRASEGNDVPWLNWVTEGVAMQSQHAHEFHTGGRRYPFSSVQPPAPPNGALRLTAIDHRLLSLFVFGGVAFVGLVFLRSAWELKLALLALIVVAVIVAGVFAPTLAGQLISSALAGAVGMVVLLWCVSDFASLQHHRRKSRAVAAASTSPFVSTPAAAPTRETDSATSANTGEAADSSNSANQPDGDDSAPNSPTGGNDHV